MKFRIAVALASACLAPPAAAQAPEPVRTGSDAAAGITASDVARRVGILADDSMMGRDTPSRGLELAAKYVADEFRRFGLRPGGDDVAAVHRFRVFGLPFLELRYAIARKRAVAAAPRVAASRQAAGNARS